MECNKCSYPNIGGVTNCSNCGSDLTKSIVISKNDYIKVIPSDEIATAQRQPLQSQNSSELSKTISQNTRNSQENLDLTKTITDHEYNSLVITGQAVKKDILLGQNSSTLKPTYLNNKTPQYNPIEFQDELTIVRANADPGDISISSKPHAKIKKKDGKWILENLASNKAVFVQVQGEVEIGNGSIVLIGSEKFYEFIPKSEEEE